MDEIKFRRTKQISVIAIFVLFISAVIFVYFKYSDEFVAIISDSVAFKAWLNTFGGWDKVIFVAIRAFQTVFKVIPAQPLEISSGYAYGTWGGMFYCMLGTIIGSLIIVVLTKLFGMKIVNLFIPEDKIKRFNFFKDSHKVNMALFIFFLIPATPKDLATWLIALTPESLPMFFLVTSIARIPSILVSTWCGHELQDENYLFSAIIFAVSIILSVGSILYYKHRYTKNNKESTDKGSSSEK